MKFLGKHRFFIKDNLIPGNNIFTLPNTLFFNEKNSINILGDQLIEGDEYSIHQFDEKESYEKFKALSNRIRGEDALKSLSFNGNLEQSIIEIKDLIDREGESHILYLILAVYQFFNHDFVNCIRTFRKMFKLVRNSNQQINEFSKRIIEEACRNITIIKDFKKDYKALNTNLISLIGCSSDTSKKSFHWPIQLNNIINSTNGGLLCAEAEGNYTYLLYSLYFDNYNSLLDAASSIDAKYYVFSCHAGADKESNEDHYLKMNFKDNQEKETKVKEVYDHIRTKLKTKDATIIILGCDLILSRDDFKNIIYYDSALFEEAMFPFTYGFFQSLIYTKDIEFSFELSKLFCSFYSNAHEHMKYNI